MRTIQTDHFNDREGGAKPTILILHYTGTLSAQEAEDYYTGVRHHGQSGRISPHYMIDKDGAITQFVDEEKRAWHAGASFWDGRSDINSHSIGIELVNPGHDRGYHPFPQHQMNALSTLARGIVSRHDIAPCCVLGHADIAPVRKPDPGEYMDWAWLAGQGIGLWPEPQPADYAGADVMLGTADGLYRALVAYGYNPDIAVDDLLHSFQQHYHTELFSSPGQAGRPCRETAARLHWLLSRKSAPLS